MPVDWEAPLRIALGDLSHRPAIEVVESRDNPEGSPLGEGRSHLVAWEESNGKHYAFVDNDGKLLATFHGGGTAGDPWVENVPA